MHPQLRNATRRAASRWRRSAWMRRVRHAPPMVTAAALGVTLSVTGRLLVSHWEDRAVEKELGGIVQRRVNIVQHGIDEYLSRLIALRALFESSDRES